MKKIIFLVLISLQASYFGSIHPMTMADMPNEILYQMALDIVMSEIAKAKTISEVDNAYKALASFARTNKQHLAIANDVKKDKALVNASKKRKLEIIQALPAILNKKSKEYSHFNISENGIDAKKVKDLKGGDLGDTALIEAAYSGHPGIALLLILNGANINEKNADGWTALMTAAYRNRKDVVRLLIDKGANVNAKNKYGMTAYDYAKANGYTDIMDILMEKMK